MDARIGRIARGQTVTAMQSAGAQPATFPKRSPVGGFIADIGADMVAGSGIVPQLDGAMADAAGPAGAASARAADTSVEGVVSLIPYPTPDQVARSVAIQRLQWLRHLPAPRTPVEYRVLQQIRTLGWSAPDES